MCVCVHVCVCVCVCTYINTHTHITPHICECTCLHVCVCAQNNDKRSIPYLWILITYLCLDMMPKSSPHLPCHRELYACVRIPLFSKGIQSSIKCHKYLFHKQVLELLNNFLNTCMYTLCKHRWYLLCIAKYMNVLNPVD